MKIKFLILGTLVGVLLGVGASMELSAQQAPANVTGWAWGGTTDNFIGNTPQSCGTAQLPCAPTHDNASGLGWISLSGTNVTGGASYGLTVPENDGNVQGYAWAENIGWIDFDAAGPYPTCGSGACPTTDVRRVNNKLVGWARVVSIPAANTNAGGFDGWIKFSNQYVGAVGGASYAGVSLVPVGATGSEAIRGFAWSNEFGWIVFGGLASGNPEASHSGANPPPPPTCIPPQVLQGGACVTPPPTCTPPQVLQGGVCVTPPPPGTVSCLPPTQTVLRNQPALFSASGGSGSYAWNAPNSTNPTGTGTNFQTTYTATGTYQVTVASGGASDQCQVSVPLFIEVPP